jgi:hypothetical protein
MKKLKKIILIFTVLSLILMTGCNTLESEENPKENETVNNSLIVDDMPLEQVSGKVIAVVNGKDITSDEVLEIQQLFLQQGQQVSKEDALEQAINQEILLQKVQDEKFVVSNQEAEASIEEQLAMQGATLEQYKQQLEMQGVSYEEILDDLKLQIATQQYLEHEFKNETFNVSDEEALTFYETYKEQSPEEVPEFEELEDQIIATLQRQKQQEATNVLIQNLRQDADVEYK